MNITTAGIDWPKTCSVCMAWISGKVLLKKTVSRDKLLECFANLAQGRAGRQTIDQAACFPRNWRRD